MLTLSFIIIPFIAALLCLFPGKQQVKSFALYGSILTLIANIYAFTQFSNDVSQQFLFDQWWIKDLGISFKIGLDGISILLVTLTNVLVPLIILSSFRNEFGNAKAFYALVLIMQAALNGVFVALDGFLFYIFWELALIPIYFICLMWGGENRVRITLKFFIYTLTGSLFMLLGLIILYLHTPGTHSFDIDALYSSQVGAETQSWLFWCFFLAFAIKIPIFPLHTWQPDTYTDAPAQGTMLLSGIMLKMGTYGILRWMIPVVPLGVMEWGNTAMILCVIGVVYASCMALVQKDFKRLLAYSSIAHVGLITAGIFALNMEGLQGSMVQMLSHGVNVVGIFFIAEIIQRRMKTRELNSLGGIANNAPMFSVLFMIILLGSVALPLTNGFVGEFLLLVGVYKYNAWMAAVAGLTVILGAVYMLRGYQKIMLGETSEKNNEFTGLHQSEKLVLFAVAAIIIAAGIYPKPILHIAQPALEELLSHVKEIK